MSTTRPSRNGLDPGPAGQTLVSPWALLAMLLVFAALAVGSLVPFRFQPRLAWIEGRLGHLGFPHSDARDVGLNLAAYAVVGMVLAWAAGGRRHRWGPVAAIVAATLAGGVTSFLLEACQTMLPGRCASWIDVGVNTAGAALGAFAWCWFTRPGGLAKAKARPLWGAKLARAGLAEAWWGRTDIAHGWEVLARAATFGVMLVALAPFDFAGTVESFGRALRRAELPPAVAVWGGRLLPAGPAPLLTSVMLSGDVLLALGFALLAATSFRSRLAQAATLAEAAGAALGRSILIAVLAETLQLFSAYHAFDLVDLARNLAAIAAGILLAALTARAPAPARTGARFTR